MVPSDAVLVLYLHFHIRKIEDIVEDYSTGSSYLGCLFKIRYAWIQIREGHLLYALFLSGLRHKKREDIIERHSLGGATYWSAATYILLFVVARFISDKFNLAQSFVTPLYPAYDIPSNILIMSYSLPGVLFIMNFANRILENSAVQVSPIIVKLSGLTFGAYLIQEFILRIFYYKSTLISFVPSFLAPWTAAIISITLSFALTYLFQRAKKRIKLCRQ